MKIIFLVLVCVNFLNAGVDRLISNDALKAYYEYRYAPQNKVFVQSDSGAFAYYTNITSTKLAKKMALTECKKVNKRFELNKPCKVININGYWQN